MRTSKDKKPSDDIVTIEEKNFKELLRFKKKYEEAKDTKLLLYSFILDRGLSENLRKYAVENELPNFDEFFMGIKPK